MLKINEKYLNVKITKGGDIYILTEGLEQNRLEYLKKELGGDYIINLEIKEEIETPSQNQKNKKK